MVNPKPLELPREQLEAKLRWYEKRYPYIGNRGVHNWKNLFRKPTMNDWVILFMLVMALFIVWAYQKDMTSLREFYEESCPSPIEVDWGNQNLETPYLNLTDKAFEEFNGEG